MNPTEPFSNVQNTSEDFSSLLQGSEDFNSLQSTPKRASGLGRGKKYPGAEIPEQGYDHADFFIMEQAYAMFESEGERRSVRMIAEYCKTGELICSYDTDDKRWHITRESVGQKIARIKALNARKAATVPQHASEQSSESPAAFTERPAVPQRPTEEAPPQSDSDPSPFALIKKLRKRILNLRILNQGKDYVITQLQEQNRELIVRVETSSRLIGQLETKVLQLEAPKRPTTAPPTSLDPAETYRDVEDVSSSHTNDPTPSVAPNEPLPDSQNDHYEHSPQQP